MSDQDSTTNSIKLSGPTQRFYQGIAAAEKVNAAHAESPFPDFTTRDRVFWFYVGAVAVDEYQVAEPDDFATFMAGAATRAPQEFGDEQDTVTVTYGGVSHQYPADVEAIDAVDAFLRNVAVDPLF
jgi:hypothetical protein